ncbi:hypothetical protein [Halosimplex carlsbadense]|uniref:hypothetical protein n=1 Tax=Halosimplex carlsbadense TaxID=171164 RepID=UPI00137853F3|nr:hypothetical protein [Halosimplex carlsbadense]
MTDDATKDLQISDGKRNRIRARVLKAEQDKLNLKLPRNINDDIEAIIREEIS